MYPAVPIMMPTCVAPMVRVGELTVEAEATGSEALAKLT